MTESIDKLNEPEIRAKLLNYLFADTIEAIKGITPEESQYLPVEEIIQFRTILTEETDRGCVLMAAAYLDSELKKLIRAKLVKNEATTKEIFGHNGALGSFSSRIDFAYLLGLISYATRLNLNLLRKIRNEFAHTASPINFKTPGISSRCNELSGFGLSNVTDPRSRFLRCMMSTLALIHGSLFKLSHIEELQDFYEQRKELLEKHLDENVIPNLNDLLLRLNTYDS